MNDYLSMIVDYMKIAGLLQLVFGVSVNLLNMLLGFMFGHEKVSY